MGKILKKRFVAGVLITSFAEVKRQGEKLFFFWPFRLLKKKAIT